MTRKFVSQRTSTFYKTSNGSGRHFVLIFGDEVQTTGNSTNDRTPVTFRGRSGFVKSSHLATRPSLEAYFLDVGQGDSTFIVTPERRKILIDGGRNLRALSFLAWKYKLDESAASKVTIDLLVVSHADGDHIDGLVPIVSHPKIRVKKVAHSGIATYADSAMDTRLGNRDSTGRFLITRHNKIGSLGGSLSDSFAKWRTAIKSEGADYFAVDSRTGMLDVGDPSVRLEVLGPKLVPLGSSTMGYPWFDSGSKHSHTINGHSVVLRLVHGDVSMLLSGDLNIEGSEHLLGDPGIRAKMDAHVLKAPHHGSHEYTPEFIEAVSPQISVISSGDGPDHGHPRANFLGGVGLASRSASPLLFSTEIAATFLETDDPLPPDEMPPLDSLDFSTAPANTLARRTFKMRLPGMINVRSDGRCLYAARRVNAGYGWESYGPLDPAPRPSVFNP